MKRNVFFVIAILLSAWFTIHTYMDVIHPEIPAGESKYIVQDYRYQSKYQEGAFIEMASEKPFTVLIGGEYVDADRYENPPLGTEFEYYLECECSELILDDGSATIRGSYTLIGEDLTPWNNQVIGVLIFAFLVIVAWIFIFRLI